MQWKKKGRMNECSKTQIENRENLRCSTNEAEYFREGVNYNMKKKPPNLVIRLFLMT